MGDVLSFVVRAIMDKVLDQQRISAMPEADQMLSKGRLYILLPTQPNRPQVALMARESSDSSSIYVRENTQSYRTVDAVAKSPHHHT